MQVMVVHEMTEENWNVNGGCTLLLTGQTDQVGLGSLRVTLPDAEAVDRLRRLLDPG